MLKIKRQINLIYITSVLKNISLTGVWVALLAARGFSLVQIGFAETVFHIASLIFEIPSGMLADIYGRKKMLIAGQVLGALACTIMAISNGFPLVCVAMACTAIGYNFESGSEEALIYDSLKSVNRQEKYEKVSSNQMIIYRLGGAISTLCAGLSLFMGYQLAYAISAVTHVVVLVLTLGLVEAVDVLLLFFLQAKVPETGISKRLLGLALFIMQLGGVVGARAILRAKNVRYRKIMLASIAGVLFGVCMEHTGMVFAMVLGGFVSAMADDALQIRTDVKLQDMFFSEKRATLISISSFTYSVVMIVMSPLAGYFFAQW